MVILARGSLRCYMQSFGNTIPQALTRSCLIPVVHVLLFAPRLVTPLYKEVHKINRIQIYRSFEFCSTHPTFQKISISQLGKQNSFLCNMSWTNSFLCNKIPFSVYIFLHEPILFSVTCHGKNSIFMNTRLYLH